MTSKGGYFRRGGYFQVAVTFGLLILLWISFKHNVFHNIALPFDSPGNVEISLEGISDYDVGLFRYRNEGDV